MATAAELRFVNQTGRFFAREYGVSPMTGRLAGWLLICDPPEQTAAEIAEALKVSRSAVGPAVIELEKWSFAQRTREPGERADRISYQLSAPEQILEAAAEYGALHALTQDGLDLLNDEPQERRRRLVEAAAFYAFMLERMPMVAAEWREHRDRLRASGDLPETDPE
jgi:DNA-binding MarR family transcriptional regulator